MGSPGNQSFVRSSVNDVGGIVADHSASHCDVTRGIVAGGTTERRTSAVEGIVLFGPADRRDDGGQYSYSEKEHAEDRLQQHCDSIEFGGAEGQEARDWKLSWSTTEPGRKLSGPSTVRAFLRARAGQSESASSFPDTSFRDNSAADSRVCAHEPSRCIDWLGDDAITLSFANAVDMTIWMKERAMNPGPTQDLDCSSSRR